MGRGIDSQPGKVYSSELIPWFLKRLQIQAQLGGGRGKAAPLKSRGFLPKIIYFAGIGSKRKSCAASVCRFPPSLKGGGGDFVDMLLR
jgi:hypothetical protein